MSCSDELLAEKFANGFYGLLGRKQEVQGGLENMWHTFPD